MAKAVKLSATFQCLYPTTWANGVTTNTTLPSGEMMTIRRTIMTMIVNFNGVTTIKTIAKTSKATNVRKTAGNITLTIVGIFLIAATYRGNYKYTQSHYIESLMIMWPSG
jgi:hypothetical protein